MVTIKNEVKGLVLKLVEDGNTTYVYFTDLIDKIWNETAGIHVISVSIESNNVTVTEICEYEYEDYDITIEELVVEEEEEEEEQEDWLGCL